MAHSRMRRIPALTIPDPHAASLAAGARRDTEAEVRDSPENTVKPAGHLGMCWGAGSWA